MKQKNDIGVWHRVAQEYSEADSYTEAMNVSGGCIVRTVTNKGGVAQTLLLNMRCIQKQIDEHLFCFVLEPGVIVP